MEWNEVTLENRPPQNKFLLWVSYEKLKTGEWIRGVLSPVIYVAAADIGSGARRSVWQSN